MARSIKKGPYVASKLEKKILAINEGKAKKSVIKTWSRHLCRAQWQQIHPGVCNRIHGGSQAGRICSYTELQRTLQQENSIGIQSMLIAQD
jgi:hypothetical protein